MTIVGTLVYQKVLGYLVYDPVPAYLPQGMF